MDYVVCTDSPILQNQSFAEISKKKSNILSCMASQNQVLQPKSKIVHTLSKTIQ